MDGEFFRGIILGLFTCPFVLAALVALWVWRMNRREKINRIGSVISPNRRWQVVTWQALLPTKSGEDRGCVKVGLTDLDGKIPDDEIFCLEDLAGDRLPRVEAQWTAEGELMISFSGGGRVEYRPTWSKDHQGPPDVRVHVERVEEDQPLDQVQEDVQALRE